MATAATAAAAAASTAASAAAPRLLPLADIAVNLADPMFAGVYRGKRAHDADVAAVVERARRVGVARLVATGTSLADYRAAVALARDLGVHASVGCHPTHCAEPDAHAPGGADAYFADLLRLVRDDRAAARPAVVAIGECGLDYDRTHFCPADLQRRHFARHFDLAHQTGLPMFLHDRNTGPDFVDMVRAHRHLFSTAVVHSFTGPLDEMRVLTDELGLYIGVNGCSIKTDEQIEVVRRIPLDRIMLETDAPWCDIRPTHASFRFLSQHGLPDPLAAAGIESRKKEKFAMGHMVKSRNEPCTMPHVLRAVAAIRGESEEQLALAAFRNTLRVFFPDDPEAAAASQ
ncbi:hypothetical protein HK105_208588 [Polyrhizophydium stewartii]|uniref:TatD DNase family protein n=1 Tax=Polyrhizophydium stewartii TaxID=2732419 RepID=A0ABR4MXD8_9FUNG